MKGLKPAGYKSQHIVTILIRYCSMNALHLGDKHGPEMNQNFPSLAHRLERTPHLPIKSCFSVS